MAAADDDLTESVTTYVQEYMSQYDASHDYNHISRVLALSKHISSTESATESSVQYDTQAVVLAALLHDVGDRKYLKSGENADTMVEEILLGRGASPELAAKVQIIAKHVSFSAEVKDPEKTKAVVARCPELAIVQDADRLDAIGAVGIGRTFTYGGAKCPRDSMQRSIDHFTEKLEKLEGMMKTATGRKMARERTERLKAFRSWWEEETGLNDFDSREDNARQMKQPHGAPGDLRTQLAEHLEPAQQRV